MADAQETIGRRLDADRRRLLDLSLRNPLLNYRPRKRGLEVVGESPAEVFRILVRDRKRMSFLPAPPRVESTCENPEPTAAIPPEKSPTDGEPDRPDDPGRDSTAVLSPAEVSGGFLADQTDLKLQTGLPLDALQTRLLATFFAARTSLEEQGVNTLFLSLGLLLWWEADDRRRVLKAPILLVPVELSRSGARERFHIRASEDELGINLSLDEKLKAEFGISVPPLPEDDELDVAAYFDRVAAAVAGQEGWSVDRGAITLGFFSFGKFLMYRDLDAETWPEDAKPGDHLILQALLQDGFREPEPEPDDEGPLDRELDADTRQVVDADSSQGLALLDVRLGRNLVIQGPPGTGKSQTITNLIAQAIGRGKSVLFVAEKMAALEVVKRRLDAVGLGGACLELHSHKTSKKAVLGQLRRALELGRPKLGPVEDDLRLLADVRDQLNAYAEAVNTPIAPSGVVPHRAFGELLELRRRWQGTLPAFDLLDLPSWTDYEYRRRLALVEQLQSRVAAVGVPSDHPFWGSRRTILGPTEGDRLRILVQTARDRTIALRDAASVLARTLGLPLAYSRGEAESLLRATRHVAESARWPGATFIDDGWVSRRDELTELLDSGAALADLHRHFEAILVPEAWDQDLAETRRALNAHGRHWWRLLVNGYRRARGVLAGIARGEPPRDLDAQLAMVDAILSARRLRELILRHDPLGARLFGPRWRGLRSDWPALAELTRWVGDLRQEINAGTLPPGLLDILARGADAGKLALPTGAVDAALTAHRVAVDQVTEFLELDVTDRFGPDAALERMPFETQKCLYDTWARGPEDLHGLVGYNHLARRCLADGLSGVVGLAESWPDAGRHLVDAFRARWFEGLLDAVFKVRPALTGFDGVSQSHAVTTFQDLDRKAIRHGRAQVAAEHWRGLPRHEGGGQLAILRREFEKKARHLPVRQLMDRAGRAVKAIAPVFMMSPLSVASYLAPGGLDFDLVVFDEASQVRPVDALGALLRGGQAVVVGDSRQLPPTHFFDRLTGGEDLDDDEESSGDVESVLGLFVAQGAPQRMLRWHYRSRHESLIAVSNHEFYDDRLVVFPSPEADRRESGLIYHHLPETHYDRGGTRTNPGEAEAVARAVMDHARVQLARPAGQRLTLGVAAFSTAQMQAIQDQIEQSRRVNPTCEEFFSLDAPEPFFVKNLENVQGDERDVVLISVGYGRTAEGRVAMNFGPLNGDGGERRLNVLITRARVRCEVFTNLTADDIDLDRTGAWGVRALKAFLAYAQSGQLDATTSSDAGPDASFEEAVRAALEAEGWEVRARVGSAAFSIDLAIVDPESPGRFLLGIVCDGAMYASARSARDRDRLRQQVLEGLGWRLHRIWSVDWYRDPQHELDRALAAIESARITPGPVVALSSTTEEALTRSGEGGGDDASAARDGPAPRPAGVPAYQLASPSVRLNGSELHAVPTARLASWVAEVVNLEGPVLAGEVIRRIAEAAGVKRVGSRIQAAMDLAFEHSAQKGTIRWVGDFLWPGAMDRPVVRDRSGLPATARRLDLVAPEEIEAAVERVVADAFGMGPGALPSATGRLLGFPRVSDDMRARMEEVVRRMVADGRLVERGGHLIVNAARDSTAESPPRDPREDQGAAAAG